MTLIELETMVQNLHHRAARVEQILPTLATRDDLAALTSKGYIDALEKRLLMDLASKDDLHALEKRLREELASKKDLHDLEKRLRQDLASKKDLEDLRHQLRGELDERFTDAKRYALVLHEDLKSDIGLIAEHLAEVMSRLPPRAS